MSAIKIIEAPAWLSDLKPWSLLPTKEVIRIFKYAHARALDTAFHLGTFPRPDQKIGRRNYWRFDTIDREIKRRLKAERMEGARRCLSSAKRSPRCKPVQSG